MATTADASHDTPRVAVIGTGGWGRNLARNLQQLGALRAIVDPCREHRDAMLAEAPGVAAHAEYQAALDDPAIDAVVIATPVATHYAIAYDALAADKDVFVEKPLTLQADAAWELVALAEARQRLLMVGHLLLFQPAIVWLRDALAAGQIGELHSIHQRRRGLGRVRDHENVLWCLGSHDIAVQRLLLGERSIERLTAHGQCLLQPAIEDDVHLHITYAGGVQTHLHCSWLWPNRDRGLMIVGSDGMLEYDEIEQVVTLHRKGVDGDLNPSDRGSEVIQRGHDQPLRLEMEHFLACVERRETCRSDGRCGAAVIDVLMQAGQQLQQLRRNDDPT
ncbi:oxidoreductase [Halorhodospira abdelmalekii]|uniref:Gfo/Idh/MocA family protein n=1 Tax=Halorhodospira abdelmalekii TaxID=421629 RepID=UPI001906F931|nr:Gfo/Idh/MocA family oxidoreductase [Halorhodospira abdelmalekii]MBK1733900.1 oxidoreductase [Halorhodospira abdelmalekii]